MPDKDEARVIQVDEVIPPGAPEPMRRTEPSRKGPVQAMREALPKFIAHYLDEFANIPGTKIKVGLDPIIGLLFPFVGDGVGAALGSLILVEGMRRGLPKPALRQMISNIALNAMIGSVPIFGDIFALWFRSNSRNYALLQRHSGQTNHPLVKPKIWPVVVFLLVILGMIAAIFWGLYLLLGKLFSL